MVTCNPQFMPLKSQNAILYDEALPSPYKTAQSDPARPDAEGPLRRKAVDQAAARGDRRAISRRGAVHSCEFPGGGLRFLNLYAIIWQPGRASACLEGKIFYEITVYNRAAPAVVPDAVHRPAEPLLPRGTLQRSRGKDRREEITGGNKHGTDDRRFPEKKRNL